MFIIENKKTEVFKIETTPTKELFEASSEFILTDRILDLFWICYTKV